MSNTPNVEEQRERHFKILSRLATYCQEIAGTISSDDPVKAVLNDSAWEMDNAAVRITRKADGLLISNARGKTRFLTFRERLAMWLLKGKSEVRP